MEIAKHNRHSFPTEQTLSHSFLKENFWKCLYSSSEKHLHYWIILPNEVKPTKLEPVFVKDLNLTIIGQYTKIESSPYLEVQVAYEHNMFEMNAADWLKNKLAKMKEEILEERVIHGKSTGTYLDCLCKKVMHSGETVISRYTVLKDYDVTKGGANYFCVKATCQEEYYKEQALSILQIVTNWDLSNKSEWQMAELLTPFTEDFVEPIKFFVPSSWEIKLDENNDKQRARFIFEHNIEEKNKGIINSFFYEINEFESPDQILAENINRFFEIDNTKIELFSLKEIDTSQISNVEISTLCKTEGLFKIMDELDAYLFVYIIRSRHGWYYFENIGPRPNFENFFWEVNKRCIEIIVSSFNNLQFKTRL